MQEAEKDSARDAEVAGLQQPKTQGGSRQIEVDAESATLQKPETQEAVKQVQVDSESAQLQKPEAQKVTRTVCNPKVERLFASAGVSTCRLADFIHTGPCFRSDVSAAKVMCAGMALGLRCLQESVLWASIILKRILLCHADG